MFDSRLDSNFSPDIEHVCLRGRLISCAVRLSNVNRVMARQLDKVNNTASDVVMSRTLASRGAHGRGANHLGILERLSLV